MRLILCLNRLLCLNRRAHAKRASSLLRRASPFICVVAPFICVVAAFAAESLPDDVSRSISLGKIHLTVPELDGLERLDKKRPSFLAVIGGKLGEARVEILVGHRPSFASAEPEDATDSLLRRLRPKEDRKGSYRFTSRDLVPGPYGKVPYASLCIGPATFRPPAPSRKLVGGELFVLGGVLPEELYTIEVYTGTELTAAHREVILDFLKTGISTDCDPIDPGWPMDEIQKRWEESVSDADVRNGIKKPFRTKHYVIMTNSSAGSLFAKKMEEAYRRVQKIFPFPEVPDRKLMPVFLFRTRNQYVDFSVTTTKMTRAGASATKGHAYRDFYATYYEAPNDPVHIHEATHQIFKNRVRLGGGRSWFQEGVAEYISTKPNERKAFARRAAKSGKFIAFRQFVEIPSLINNSFLDAGASYLQAASLIQFLRDGRFQPKKFPLFVELIGALPRGDVKAIDKVIGKLYDTNLEGLEEAWVKYWAHK